jgi:hypothetical protein
LESIDGQVKSESEIKATAAAQPATIKVKSPRNTISNCSLCFVRCPLPFGLLFPMASNSVTRIMHPVTAEAIQFDQGERLQRQSFISAINI